jgi:16S rRNA (cytosine1402-N4)-methyltransferase
MAWASSHHMSLQGSPGTALGREGMEFGHLPVMVGEAIAALSPAPGSLQIDATVGGGGHAERILEASNPDGRLVGLDADRAAIARARARLARFGDRVVLREANFADIADVVSTSGFAPPGGFVEADGILFDLGLSSDQLADLERGFSFRSETPLDMRFDVSRGTPAHELLASLPVNELAAIFRRYGEEPFAGRIARAIVTERDDPRTLTGAGLAALIERVTPRGPRRRIHPATRVFQALRIAVNGELESLERGLAGAVGLLRPGGRLVVISYHSLEDRIVKRFFAAERRGCTCPPELPVCVCGRKPRLRLVGRQPLRPSPAETLDNPRSRSARLRAAERAAA